MHFWNISYFQKGRNSISVKLCPIMTEIFMTVPSTSILVFVGFMAALLLFAIMSNILLIYCVVRIKKLRTVTNIFICNLSVSDILLAGFIMPQKLHDIFHKDHFHEGNFIFVAFYCFLFVAGFHFVFSFVYD